METPHALELFELYLRRKGQYCTATRQLIAQAVCAQQEPFDAKQVWTQLLTEQVGMSTIYRTLDLLEEAGLIRRLPDDIARFECLYQRPCREYLRCDSCGKWIAFPCEGLDQQLKEIAQHLGFTVRARSLVLQGVCRECKLKNAAQATPTW